MANFPFFYRGKRHQNTGELILPVNKHTTPIDINDVRLQNKPPSLTVTWYHERNLIRPGYHVDTGVIIQDGFDFNASHFTPNTIFSDRGTQWGVAPNRVLAIKSGGSKLELFPRNSASTATNVETYGLPATPADETVYEFVKNAGSIFAFQPRTVSLSMDEDQQELAWNTSMLKNFSGSNQNQTQRIAAITGRNNNTDTVLPNPFTASNDLPRWFLSPTDNLIQNYQRFMLHYAVLISRALKDGQYGYRRIILDETTREPFHAWANRGRYVEDHTKDAYQIIDISTIGLTTGDTIRIQNAGVYFYTEVPTGSGFKDSIYLGQGGNENPYAGSQQADVTIPARTRFMGVTVGRLASRFFSNGRPLSDGSTGSIGELPGVPARLFERVSREGSLADSLDYFIIGTGLNLMMHGVHSSTWDTAKLELRQLAADVKKVFTDAGITNTKIAYCPYYEATGVGTQIPVSGDIAGNGTGASAGLRGHQKVWGNKDPNDDNDPDVNIAKGYMYQPSRRSNNVFPSTGLSDAELAITECPSLDKCYERPWISNWNLTGSLSQEDKEGNIIVRNDKEMREYLKDVTNHLKTIPNLKVVVGRIDHRRYPIFPSYQNWPDRKALRYSPHLNAKISDTSVKDIIEQVCEWVGANVDVEKAGGYVSGYLINQVATPRNLIEPLLKATFNIAGEIDGKVTCKHITKLDMVKSNYDHLALVNNEEKTENATAQSEGYEVYNIVRAQETDLPKYLRLSYLKDDGMYEQAIAEASMDVTSSIGIHDDQVPLLLTPFDAQEIADMLLHRMWMAREAVQLPLPPNNLDIESTDCLDITLNERQFIFLIMNISLAEHRVIEGVQIDPEIFRRIRRDR